MAEIQCSRRGESNLIDTECPVTKRPRMRSVARNRTSEEIRLYRAKANGLSGRSRLEGTGRVVGAWHGLMAALCVAMAFGWCAGAAGAASPVSKTVTEVLRAPLPPEDLNCTVNDTAITVAGPTFYYTVDRSTGAIARLEATRETTTVVEVKQPALWFDELCLSKCTGGTTEFLAQGRDKVVLSTRGILREGVPYPRETTGVGWLSDGVRLREGVPYTLETTFYNDGVAVSEITLQPRTDFALDRGIRFEAAASGRFGHYLHKRRDTNGTDCFQGALPPTGETVALATLTSCLEVFSHEAALAVFTDRGGTYRQPADAPTASLAVEARDAGDASVVLTQHIVRIDAGGEAFVVRGGESFTFRTGLAVAPNRVPHPRWRDLRMFIWIGDGKHPYPTDDEIRAAARLGFTLFQMHRLGTPGIPRPPADEFDRVLNTVHDAGMLFIWTANADLMYANAPGVRALRETGQWSQWQGFNYGGRYTAPMDPYCDLAATCLASPNGLADYRMDTIAQMLEAYPVDGMYIDDNLPYANCTLWKEHGHPENVYDCLIELHDVSWRRRQALLAKVPHAVLIDHSSHAFILPAISAFDCHLFGEGYSFSSVESFWAKYGSYHNQPAQGCLWAGDSEGARCGAELAYAYDLLTGGGQYSYLDWRLWPEKFPYASGVSADEVLFVETFNPAQYYFGMYESTPYYFATARDRFETTAPNTHATLYHNRTWNDALVVVSNLGKEASETSVKFKAPLIPPFSGNQPLAVYDVHERTSKLARGKAALACFAGLPLAPNQTRLLYVREVPEHGVYHQWGGKRIAEQWGPRAAALTLTLHGPATREDRVIVATGGKGIGQVTVNGAPAEFFVDAARGMIHGKVTFGLEPVDIAVVCAPDGANKLREQALTPDKLSAYYTSKTKP